MLIHLDGNTAVNPADVLSAKVPDRDTRYVRVTMRDGAHHLVECDYGKGVYATYARIVDQINAACAKTGADSGGWAIKDGPMSPQGMADQLQRAATAAGMAVGDDIPGGLVRAIEALGAREYQRGLIDGRFPLAGAA